MDRHTGQPLDGWPAVLQSLAVIFTTPIGSRRMRLDFGSEVPALVGRPMTTSNILALYVATADAVARWEPRVRLLGVKLLEASPGGALGLLLRCEYEGSVVEGEVRF